jgi:hypothetical protein
MRRTKAVDEQLVKLCKLELKKQGIRGENGRRLQAIISAKEHGIKQVAAIYNISRETLMRWINKFGGAGSAKTHLAIGLAFAAIEKSYRVRFYTLNELATQLLRARIHNYEINFMCEIHRHDFNKIVLSII